MPRNRQRLFLLGQLRLGRGGEPMNQVLGGRRCGLGLEIYKSLGGETLLSWLGEEKI